MSPILASSISSVNSNHDSPTCATDALVFYIFRVPGSQDLCLSTFKPHADVVTALDILLAAYYVNYNTNGTYHVLRGGELIATLEQNRIEVRVKIEDSADVINDERVVARKRLENGNIHFFTTSIEEVDRRVAAGHRKSSVEGVNSNGSVSYSGLDLDQLRAAAARLEGESGQTGSTLTSSQQFKEKLRTAKRGLASSEFRDQMGQRCLFYSSVTGQDLRCDQVLPGMTSSNASVPLSELRFNLPGTSETRKNSDHTTASGPTSLAASEDASRAPRPSPPRHKRFSEPFVALVKGHAERRRPLSTSHLKTHITTRSEEQHSLPGRPSLPRPRQHTQSESAIDATQPSFTIKRKAVHTYSPDSVIHPSHSHVPRLPPRPLPPTPPYDDNIAPDIRNPSILPHLPHPLQPTPIPSQIPSPDAAPRLDLTLAHEPLGGGFRGHQAKLGKLLVYGEGSRMLDLLVVANLCMFLRAWRGGNGQDVGCVGDGG